jgi:hypothetical protein
MSMEVLPEIMNRPGPIIGSSMQYLPVEDLSYRFDSKSIEKLSDRPFVATAEHGFHDGVFADGRSFFFRHPPE